MALTKSIFSPRFVDPCFSQAILQALGIFHNFDMDAYPKPYYLDDKKDLIFSA
jgi:hypothetical protein